MEGLTRRYANKRYLLRVNVANIHAKESAKNTKKLHLEVVAILYEIIIYLINLHVVLNNHKVSIINRYII